MSALDDPDAGALHRFRWAWYALLAATVVQAVGVWRWFVVLGETPLLEWLHSPPDVGGWGIAEGTAQAIQLAVGWSALAAAAWCLWRPSWAPAVLLAAVQMAIAWAMTATDEGFPVAASWLPAAARRAFPWLTHAARMAAPLAVAWLAWGGAGTAGAPCQDAAMIRNAPWGLRCAPAPRFQAGIEQLLRWALAITFAAHGVEALQTNPVFVDLLLDSHRRWLDIDLPEARATELLTAIGVMDLLVAALCVSTRWRWVLWWMAAWGLITAWSRVAANGWFWWHDAVVRAPHVGVPAAIAWLAPRADTLANRVESPADT
ncbi:MAG: hypothetical protein KDA44_07370 [Planctomycetales bacterium]|nr:hypothetical protein [Planctomycetales bacterium]